MKVLTNENSAGLLHVLYVTQLDLLLTTAMNVGYFLAFFSAVLASALPCTTVDCCVMNNFGHHNQLSSGELYSHHVETNDFSMFDYFFINNMKVKALTWFYSREREPLNNRILARTQKLCRLSIQLSKCDSSYLTLLRFVTRNKKQVHVSVKMSREKTFCFISKC